MKTTFPIIRAMLAAACVLPLQAKEEAPRGYTPLAEYQEAKSRAGGKKLVALLVKGANDDCPNCVSAVDNGEKAIGSGVVKLFSRAETIREQDTTHFSPALKERIQKGFTTGASVTFVILNPDMTEILVEAGRDQLQDDKKAIAAFKKAVQEAKKALR